MPSAATWKFELLTHWDEVLSDSFWSQWERWYQQASSPHVFYSVPLAKAWLETYLPLRNLQPLYVIGECDGARTFQPLLLWRRNWKHAFQRLIIPVGYSDYDYHDPVVVAPPDTVDWSGYWNSLADFLLSKPARGADLVIDAIRFPAAGATPGSLSLSEVSPFIDLAALAPDVSVLDLLEKSLRKDLLRRRKRLAEQGELTYQRITCDGLDTALAELPTMLHHHQLRWPAAYKAPGFHQRLLLHGIPSGRAALSCLRLNHAAIAWNIDLSSSTSTAYYMPAYDEAYRAFNPGLLLLLHTIESATRNGFFEFDFLRGQEAYKSRFTPCFRQLYRLERNSSSPLSRACLQAARFLHSHWQAFRAPAPATPQPK